MRCLFSLAVVALLAFPISTASSAEIDSTAKNIIGAWKLDFTTPDDVKRTPIVIIGRQHQDLVAWYVDKEKREAFKDVQLKDDALCLTIRPMERPDMTVTFEAKLKDEGVCVGTGMYESKSGDTGSWEFSGRRVPTSTFDEVHSWKLSFVTPDDQPRSAVVTVLSKNDKLFAWYSSDEHELPATKITKDGDDVVMSITAKTQDGATVDVVFRGTIDGDQVAGNAEYDLEGDTGSFSFRGERKRT